MTRFQLTSILAASALVLWLAGAAAQQRRPDIGDTYPFNKTKQGDEKLLEQMKGAWRLSSYTDGDLLDTERRDEVGFAVITDDYMSMEIHLGWHRPNRTPLGLLSAGTHKYRLRTGGRIELRSVIGTFVNNAGQGRAEVPGQQRIYDISIVNNQLVLEDIAQRRKLTFDRLSGPRTDIYGRPIEEPEEAGAEEEQPPTRRRTARDRR